MPLDIDRARAETRGLENRVHLNNAGAALMPAPVADHLRAYLTAEEMFGGYETAATEHAALENLYTAGARLRTPSRMKLPLSKTPPGPGTWRSTRCRWGRATAF